MTNEWNTEVTSNTGLKWFQCCLPPFPTGLPLWLSWKTIHLQYGRPGFYLWVGKIQWRRKSLSTPVFWPGEFRGLYGPCGCKESDMTEWLLLTPEWSSSLSPRFWAWVSGWSLILFSSIVLFNICCRNSWAGTADCFSALGTQARLPFSSCQWDRNTGLTVAKFLKLNY